MSSHSRPTCGIWRKWSISHRLVKPASSAARATSASAAAVSPAARSRSATPAGRTRAASAPPPGGRRPPGAVRNAGGTSSTGPGGVDAGEALAGQRARRAAAASRSCAATTLAGTGAPRARLRSRTTFSGASSDDRVRRHAARSASARQAARRFALQPGRVDHRREAPPQPLRDDQVEHLERVAARALVALAARRRPRAGDPRTRPGRRGTTRAPRPTCPPPSPRPGRRGRVGQAQRHS